MRAPRRWLVLPLLLVGALAGSAHGTAARVVAKVHDDGGFFSPDAIKKANGIITEIYDKFGKDLLIETFKEIPADRAEAYKKADQTADKDERRKARTQFFNQWARDLAKEDRVNGVYVLICKNPPHLEVEVGNKTQQKDFTLGNRDELARLMLRSFGKAHESKDEAEQRKYYDQGLIEGSEFVRDTMKKNGASRSELPPVGNGNEGQGQHAQHGWGGGGMGLTSWICPLLLVVGVVWIVIALIRAVTGGGRPAYGPGPGGMAQGGPGYGYGGGGGGGGGFMSGLLGGMFGAAAGSWMYDKWFRGDSGGGYGAGGGGFGGSSSYGATPDSGGGQDTDYSGSGGDYGGDSGGGGGGGDFGGGGGDFGGGGGGDFGGGGGDFGGGGGDSGGGGGGGDF